MAGGGSPEERPFEAWEMMARSSRSIAAWASVVVGVRVGLRLGFPTPAMETAR
jgi:hypothetical protein